MSEQVIYCPNCGGENQPNYRFCMHCGAELQSVAAQAGEESPLEGAPPPPPPASAIPEPEEPAAPPTRRGISALTCVVLAVIVLCVCGAAASLAWFYGDYVLQILGINI
jgi:uncharacterized membrane protein YvbJ